MFGKKKILKVFLSSLALVFLVSSYFSATTLTAKSETMNEVVSKAAVTPAPSLQVQIPGLKSFSNIVACGDAGFICIPWFGQYIYSIYNYMIGTAGILSAVMLMLGGFIWATAAGDSSKIGEAKTYIGGAILGLILTMTAQTILMQVNSELGSIKSIKVRAIDPKDIDASAFDKIARELSSPTTGTGAGASGGTSKPPTEEDKKKFCQWKETGGASCADTYGAGWAPRDEKSAQNCNPETKENSVCCCLKFGGGWQFDRGIQAQMADASGTVIGMLACLRPELPTYVGRISSISDSAGLVNCQKNYSKKCAHGKNSCHYGPKKSPKTGPSEAVDFGDEEYKKEYDRAFAICKSYISLALFEGNHYHVSTSGCVGQ